ncbi:MAG: hypothetical protein V4558_03850 [Gemmatimonadota bacterium]
MQSSTYATVMTFLLVAAGAWGTERSSGLYLGTGPEPAAFRPDSTGERAVVYRTWWAYFNSKEQQLARFAGVASSLWVADEQAKWPMYDLAGSYVPGGSAPAIVGVRQLAPGSYEIQVRFGTMRASWGVVKVGDRWLLQNVLDRRVAAWRRETVGPIRYHIEPTLTFNRARAEAAVAFVDSLAPAFATPPVTHLDYYVTPTVDAALAALGVEYDRKFGPGGAFAKPVNYQIFSAIPSLGENYRHELVHVVLRPLLEGRSITIIASEGIATWLGGTSGMTLSGAVRALDRYLTEHPRASLDSAITPGAMPQTESYTAGAVLCGLLYRRGGVAALRRFLQAGPGQAEVRAVLIRELGEPWERIRAEWRARVAKPVIP